LKGRWGIRFVVVFLAAILLLQIASFSVPTTAEAQQVPQFFFEFGSRGSGPGQFNGPFGVATDSSDRIIVVDGNNNRIQVFDSTGAFKFEFGSSGSGPGQFSFHTGVATDRSDRIIVTDGSNHRIQVFEETSSTCTSGISEPTNIPGTSICFLFEFGSLGSGPGQFNFPAGVATDSSDRIIVTDVNNHRIEVFDSTGAFKFEFGSLGSGPGQFNDPFGVATDRSDRIIVADIGNNRIQVFEETSSTCTSGISEPTNIPGTSICFLFEFDSLGSGPGQFNDPSDVATDSSDRIIVMDRGNNRIEVFDSTGAFKFEFGSLGSGPGQFNFPAGVATDSSDRIIVADRKNHRIQVFKITAPPFLIDFEFRKMITINKDKVIDNPHTDFPVLISIERNSEDASELAANARDDGDDIVFTSSDGTTKLDHEVEKFDGSTGELVAWVRVPLLSSSEDTILFMYYGNNAASNQENPAGVWDSNYAMVQHLNEDANPNERFEIKDSTTNSNDGDTGSGNFIDAPRRVFSGQIGPALAFDGINDHILIKDSKSIKPQKDFTIETWFNPDRTNRAGNPHILGKQFGDSFFNSYIFWISANNQIGFHSAESESRVFCCKLVKDGIEANEWSHIAVTKDGTTMTLYFNGQEITSIKNNVPESVPYDSNVLFIGADDNDAVDRADGFWDGFIDEVRISNIARTGEWIETQFNNQNSPSKFISLGQQERLDIQKFLCDVKVELKEIKRTDGVDGFAEWSFLSRTTMAVDERLIQDKKEFSRVDIRKGETIAVDPPVLVFDQERAIKGGQVVFPSISIQAVSFEGFQVISDFSTTDGKGFVCDGRTVEPLIVEVELGFSRAELFLTFDITTKLVDVTDIPTQDCSVELFIISVTYGGPRDLGNDISFRTTIEGLQQPVGPSPFPVILDSDPPFNIPGKNFKIEHKGTFTYDSRLTIVPILDRLLPGEKIPLLFFARVMEDDPPPFLFRGETDDKGSNEKEVDLICGEIGKIVLLTVSVNEAFFFGGQSVTGDTGDFTFKYKINAKILNP